MIINPTRPQSQKPPYYGYAPPLQTPPTQYYTPPTYTVGGGVVCPCTNDFKCDWWKYLLGAAVGVIAGYVFFKEGDKKKEAK